MPALARRRRSRLPTIVGVLAVLALVWTGLWFLAVDVARSALARWLEREANEGRAWSCDAPETGGFPLGIELRCPGIALAVETAEGRRKATAGAFSAGASLLRPGAIVASLAAPLEAGPLRLTWSHLELTVLGPPLDFASATLTLARPVASRADAILGQAETAALTVVPAPGIAASEHALQAQLEVAKAAVPQLDALDRSAAPLDLDLQAVATRTDAAADLDWPGWLESWRAAGGRIDVGRARLAKAPVELIGAGTLSLDAAHRVQGSFDAGAAGIEALAAQAGVPLGALKLGGLLGALGGGKAASGPGAGLPYQLRVKLKDGKVQAGPLQLPLRLTPLY